LIILNERVKKANENDRIFIQKENDLEEAQYNVDTTLIQQMYN